MRREARMGSGQKFVVALMLGLGLVGALPCDARADVGVPMIFLTLPGMVAALLPVIAVEMLVLRRMLSLPTGRALKVSSLANVATTFLGIPLTWLALVVLEMVTGGGRAYGIDTPLKKFLAVTWQGPWLIPYEEDKNLYWMVPTAAMWLLIPSFFMSWWLEFLVAARMLRDTGRAQVKSAMLRANLISYAMLELVVFVYLAYIWKYEL